MSPPSFATAGAVLFAALLTIGMAQSAQAQIVGGTNVWVIVGAPSMVTYQGMPAGETIFSSKVNETVLGLVYVVVRNSLGQMVFANVTTNTIAGLQISAPALDIIFNVPIGTYTATFFATNAAGVAISTSTTIQFTLPLSG